MEFLYSSKINKFYTKIDLKTIDDGFGIFLDEKQLKSPAGYSLKFKSKQFSESILNEWLSQNEKVDPSKMPMTVFYFSMLDRIIPVRSEVENRLLSYAETDLLCYRARRPLKLAQRQKALWDPLINWMQNTHGISLLVTCKILPIDQPSASIKNLLSVIKGLSSFQLTALSSLVPLTSSLIASLALVLERINALEAFSIINLDENFQNEKWGKLDEVLKRQNVIRDEIRLAEEFVQLSKLEF